MILKITFWVLFLMAVMLGEVSLFAESDAETISPTERISVTAMTDKKDYFFGEPIVLKINNDNNASLHFSPTMHLTFETIRKLYGGQEGWGPHYSFLGTPCEVFKNFNCEDLVTIPAHEAYVLTMDSQWLSTEGGKPQPFRIRIWLLIGKQQPVIYSNDFTIRSK